jgi:hypothetical protein
LLLLLFIFLLFEHLLVIGVVAWCADAATVVSAGAETTSCLHTCAAHSLLLHSLHLLHLLHLCHHCGVHALHASHCGIWALRTLAPWAASHLLLLLHGLQLLHLLHLSQHGGIHCAHHASTCTHGHLLLHRHPVLLHLLKVLRHHLRSHSTWCHLVGSTMLLLLVIVRMILPVITRAPFSESISSTPSTFFLLAHVTSRLRFFDFDGLAKNFERYV